MVYVCLLNQSTKLSAKLSTKLSTNYYIFIILGDNLGIPFKAIFSAKLSAKLSTNYYIFIILGDNLGTPFKAIGFENDMFSPAISLSKKERARMVFKAADLQYLPSGYI